MCPHQATAPTELLPQCSCISIMWPPGEHLGLVQANHRVPGFKSLCSPLSAILRFLAATSVPLSWESCWVDIKSASLGQMEITGQILYSFCGYVTVWYVCHAAAGGVASWGTSLGDTEVHHILGYQIHHMLLHWFFLFPRPHLLLFSVDYTLNICT